MRDFGCSSFYDNEDGYTRKIKRVCELPERERGYIMEILFLGS